MPEHRVLAEQEHHPQPESRVNALALTGLATFRVVGYTNRQTLTFDLARRLR